MGNQTQNPRLQHWFDYLIPGNGQGVGWNLLALCLMPVTAPITFVVGFGWMLLHGTD